MTGPRNEAALAGEGEEAGIESDQVSFVFGHRRGEVVEPDFARTTAEGVEGVEVTADKGFEALAVSELQVHFAAVTFDEAESIQLARSAVVEQRAEVSPIDFEAFAGTGLHAHIGATFLGIGA